MAARPCSSTSRFSASCCVSRTKRRCGACGRLEVLKELQIVSIAAWPNHLWAERFSRRPGHDWGTTGNGEWPLSQNGRGEQWDTVGGRKAPSPLVGEGVGGERPLQRQIGQDDMGASGSGGE